MKKVLKLSFAFAMAGLALVGCTKDDEEEEDLSPVMYVETPAGGTINVEPGDAVSYSITMSTNDKLEVLSGSVSIDGASPSVLDLNGAEEGTDVEIDNDNNKSFTYEDIYLTGSTEATHVLSFTVTDNKDRTSSISITIKTEFAVSIAEYTTTVLYSQEGNGGSSYNAIENQVFTLENAQANSEKVDFMYFKGASNLHSLAAPSSTAASQVFNGTNGVASWSTTNSTTLSKENISVTQFENVETAGDITDLSSEPTGELANMLAVGDIVAFKLDAARGGKNGLAKIDEINETEHTMTISVKIEL